MVLTRKLDETIMIGDDISITIIQITPQKVRIGIDAPNNCPVHRQEVYDAIKRDFPTGLTFEGDPGP